MASPARKIINARNSFYRSMPRPVRSAMLRAVYGARTLTGAPFASSRLGTVCMLHTGRCGSSVLAGLLGQHKRVYWDSEVHFKRWHDSGGDETPYDPAAFVSKRRLMAGGRYYGFEVKFEDHLDPRWLGLSFARYVERIDPIGVTHWILLERKNHLRQVVSVLQAEARGGHHNVGGKASKLQKITIPIDAVVFFQAPARPLASVLESLDAAYREAERLLAGRPLLHLTYEDDISADPRNAYERVCSFLDIQPGPADVTHKKTNPFPIADSVENWPEVEQALAGTPYAWMLEG